MTKSANVPALNRPISEEYKGVFADILSQAITGELVGMANYAAMVRLYPDPRQQRDAVENAASELRHSEAFARAARDLGVQPIVDVEAPYWRRLRLSFLRYVDAGDLTACLVIQEVMLESFAVALYQGVAEVAHDELAGVFRAIGGEEQAHGDAAIEALQLALDADREGFENKVEVLHDEVMTTLAEMLGAKDSVAHCGLCHGSCVKGSLDRVGLDRASLRGRALHHYLRTLDQIGVRGERSLGWVTRLPL
jgi:fatty aldehyde decarbonylase